jgi:acyl carrier protein
VTSVFQHLISKGASFQVLEVDLSKQKELAKIEQHLLHEVDGPVETLIHCAGIYEEFNFNQEIPDTVLDNQACIKNGSAMFLHDLSLKLDGLKHFIIVGSSSMDTLAHFMCTYSATNSMLAGLARKRESMQLPCTILNMTSIKDVGLVQKDRKVEQFQRTVGIEAISSIRAIGALETIMSRGISSMLHYQYFSPEKKENVHSYWSETLGTAAVSSAIVFGTLSSGQKKQTITTYDEIFSYIKGIIQELFGEQEISPGTLISSMGIDSFGMIEFGQHLQADLGFKVDPTVLSLTVGEFTNSIYKKTTS